MRVSRRAIGREKADLVVVGCLGLAPDLFFGFTIVELL